MEPDHRPIFREEALRRYVASREQSVLPQLVSPQTFLYLWLLLGLLVGSSLLAWFTRIPVYVSGPAVVVRFRNTPAGEHDSIGVATFLPPHSLPGLRSAPRVFLHFEAMGVGGTAQTQPRFSRPILAVEPTLRSPDSVRQHFGLNAATGLSLTQPVVVVITALDPLPSPLSPTTYLGSVGRAEVQVRSQRAISLLPLIGPLFDGS